MNQGFEPEIRALLKFRYWQKILPKLVNIPPLSAVDLLLMAQFIAMNMSLMRLYLD